MASTKVLTAKGLERIEDVEVGDKVLARDEVTGKQGYKRVLKLNRGKAVQVCRVTVGRERRSAAKPRAGEDGVEGDGEPPPDRQEILCTRDHPFYSVSRKRWVEADALEPGELLQSADTGPGALKVFAVEHWAEEVATFNFEVEDWHTYFVAAAGVLVHNGPEVVYHYSPDPPTSARYAPPPGSPPGAITIPAGTWVTNAGAVTPPEFGRQLGISPGAGDQNFRYRVDVPAGAAQTPQTGASLPGGTGHQWKLAQDVRMTPTEHNVSQWKPNPNYTPGANPLTSRQPVGSWEPFRGCKP